MSLGASDWPLDVHLGCAGSRLEVSAVRLRLPRNANVCGCAPFLIKAPPRSASDTRGEVVVTNEVKSLNQPEESRPFDNGRSI
jgi:hypothetical protein